ncbi:PREDICTED: G-type lectin S-receptor-like serine/threonine-protein kinase At4g27290 [Ipomoea nil]|uniref:G-type lectin S-receptor-like serine/threonine-protein kinase At4g27290 n=1 Tax=Ipomoea nil TaxID=35883 RepID=UPI000900CCF7|nr:PREDICTED: G-type lectin S-receptor-like serine/threonine-protein kinase At4g27290 [Ipomoea nil]
MEVLFPVLVLSFLLSISNICLGKDIDIISRTEFLKDGDTIISKGGTFVMGFFSPTNSSNRYVGIWYNQIPVQTVVWVANRDAPLANTSSAVLKITLGGQLSLVGDKGQAVWSANTSRSSVQNPVAELLDSGNLVVRDADDESPENFLWQSFDYPTDNFLSRTKVGWNLQTGHEVFLTAWKSENDPASGQYTLHLIPTGYPQFIIKNGTTEIFSTGPWNGLRFSVSTVEQNTNTLDPQEVVINKKEVYYRYNPSNDLGLFRFVVTSNGFLKAWVWEDEIKQWVNFRSQPADICGTYGLCGGNAVCDIQQLHGCVCLDKFLPNNNATATGSLPRGCHRRKPLSCHNNGSSSDGFLKYSDIKLPDTKHSWYNESLSLQECEQVCLRNCSCMAYSTLNISNGGSGCLFWYGDLVDMRTVHNGQDMFIRLATSEMPEMPGLKAEPHHSTSFRRKIKILALCLSLLVVIVLAGVYIFLYFCKRKRKEQKLKQELELPIFDWSTISRATNNFSEMNKLGQGGFGVVYKGALDGGEEIAVKRLSKNSKQGLEEFKNEVICIAKLQHRNLVKLLGCCIRGEEKMLIYEYMPNKSLGFFIFDQTKKKLLDWPKRFNIINGVARWLLYLHQDSRLRIIHRDLKISNVLLDIDLNPKISDFGLARSIVGNAMGDNTKRVAGTYGYMSPEYAGHGIFSIKSDVFSFGISVLEIVSGRRNSEFINEDQYMTLPEHAWKLYREGKSIALVDKDIAGPYDVVQVLRSIHVALLCVQQSPEDRPHMSSVVQMLVNDFALPQAKEPGFFFGKEYPPRTHAKSSLNEITITTLSPR